MAGPLVLHIPHSSRQIPTEERARFLLEDAELDAQLLRMTDAFTEELFPSTNAEAGRVVHGVSRLLCDPERFREDVLEPMAAKGMGALYALQSVQRHGRSVQVNRPFAGALVPMAYYAREPRVLGIMVEINRSLYMEESTGIRIASWSRVANEMKLLMEEIARGWEARLKEGIGPSDFTML